MAIASRNLAGAEPAPAPADRPAAALSSSELIVQDIMRGLYEGRYAPGQRLIEIDLTRRYGVSRGSVREALSRLSADGIVLQERHRGAYVRSVDRGEALESLRMHEVLVGLSARLAAERIADPGMADRMRQATEVVLSFDPQSTSPDYGVARRSFFETLTEVGGNRELARVLASQQLCLVGMQLREYTAAVHALRSDDFRAIAEAILTGKGEEAEHAARRHLRRVTDAIAATRDQPLGGLLRRGQAGA